MNYIQPNISMNTNDFGFSKPSAQSQDKPFADLSFAEALKAAYKNDRFASERKEESAPEKAEASYSSEKKELAKDAPVESDGVAGNAEKTGERLAKDDSKVGENGDYDKKVADAKSGNDEGENAEEISDDAGSANSEIAAAASVKAERTAEDVALSNDDAEHDSEIDVSKIDAGSKIAASAQKNAELSDSSDVDSLVKSKMAELAGKNDSVETSEENSLPDNFEDLLHDNGGKMASNAAEKDRKEKSAKNGFEKLNVHDLRTERKVDFDNQPAKSVAKAKVANAGNVGQQTAKVAKKNGKDEKDAKSERILNLNQNLAAKSKGVSQNELKVAYRQDSQDSVQLTMELAAKANQNITSSSAQAAAAHGSDFQQMLSNTVQHNAAEFVKAGNIILKDANQGTINLILKPESLGNVKISLSLSDKTISGQILVASKEAYDAFRDNIESIKQA
ncbi:MAG: flagellar hook-length control protein FliK, partial [Treponema sp.]|nr:flagellar hook-length control protein FliK [Treponema sp.]